jgi:exonuclease III
VKIASYNVNGVNGRLQRPYAGVDRDPGRNGQEQEEGEMTQIDWKG